MTSQNSSSQEYLIRWMLRGMVTTLAASIGIALTTATLARADTVLVWGNNAQGQLGIGTKTSSRVTTHISSLGNGVTSADGSRYAHNLAIVGGTVVAWGANENGELGNGTYDSSDVPVPIAQLGKNIIRVAGGRHHSLALTHNGAVLAWGYNQQGQLGTGTNATHRVPTPVPNLAHGVTFISSGSYHSFAIQNGAAYAWGNNGNGELGNGTFTNSNSPVPVVRLDSRVTSIVGGYYHSLAIRDGAVYAWGYNGHGQLGHSQNATKASNVPLLVPGLGRGVTSIAAGDHHSLAIQDGAVYAWGQNAQGQLGTGATLRSNTPVLALYLSVPLVAVAAGSESSYALSSDGSLWMWGRNNHGQLGQADTTDRLTPTQLLPPSGHRFTSIAAGHDHAIATVAPVSLSGGVAQPQRSPIVIPASGARSVSLPPP